MMSKLICAFVVRKQQSQGFSRRGPFDVEAGLHLCLFASNEVRDFRVEAHMMSKLICAFVVRKQQSQGFSRRGPFDVEAGLRLCCSQATKSGVFPSRPI